MELCLGGALGGVVLHVNDFSRRSTGQLPTPVHREQREEGRREKKELMASQGNAISFCPP
jgi:hypothetical protein